MKLEPGKYYQHSEGRAIYVAGMVKTFRWKEMLVIEEVDPTGHSISCVELDNAEDLHGRWTETGKEEWMKHFNGRLIA